MARYSSLLKLKNNRDILLIFELKHCPISCGWKESYFLPAIKLYELEPLSKAIILYYTY